jgi:hypothetical protein
MGLMAVSRKKRKVLVTCILGILLIGDIFCMNMKTSFFCGDDSNSETDSNTYDQIYYMIDQKGEEIVSDQTFTVLSYKMNLRLKQIMYADVTLELEKNASNTYPMTLYHQYEVDTVTDGDGNTLEYERKGDYLTVFGGEGKNICITYHGGLSNCYSNRQAMFLPGWFAYYPIPGYHTIIEEYQYIENWQEEKVEYDITVDTDVSVFSNLPRVEENHFRGNTKGATLISGFVAEAELDNGIRCIYPYLDRWDDPVKDVEDTSININQSEDRQRVLDILEKNWTEDSEKVIIIYPVNLMNADITWTEDTLMGNLSWHNLYSRYQENHTFLDVAEPTDSVETIQRGRMREARNND